MGFCEVDNEIFWISGMCCGMASWAIATFNWSYFGRMEGIEEDRRKWGEVCRKLVQFMGAEANAQTLLVGAAGKVNWRNVFSNYIKNLRNFD
jgi:hypothetical protein